MRSRLSWLRKLALAVGLTMGAGVLCAQAALDIQVKEAWIRWLPPGIPAGGYMTLVNTGSSTRVLVGAVSPDYGEISFHQSVQSHGMSQMTPVDSVVLKPQATVLFAEGGYHLMLMQPKRPIHPGDHVSVTLRFADGRSIEVPFDVR